MELSDYYEAEYPTHCRTSCSDENPVNAEVNGHGCLRCNAIFFTNADALKEAVRLTLEENAHLADGDDCTLVRLKNALQPNV